MQNALLENILAKIRPSPQEEGAVKKFVGDLLTTAKTISGLDSVMCGSIGKFTWLKGDHDIDLFMLFPKSVPRPELERRGLDYGKRITADMNGTFVIKYAEHPYVHASIGGYSIDIVPCYRISKGEKIISAVDRSPLHLQYVLENLPAEKRDEVRLLKQFCKGVGVYGSDTKHQGFSGYICELLVIKYGSFIKTVKDAAKWGAPKVIGGDSKRFPNQPLVIIDPVDSKRNVASSLSSEKFIKFTAAARRFVEQPGEIFFFPQEKSPLCEEEIREISGRGTQFFAIIMEKPDLIDDVLYPQMRRALDRIETMLKHNDFSLVRKLEYADGKAVLLFEMEKWELPRVKKMIGPAVFSKRHSREFRSKYKHVSVEDIYWVADKEREFRSAGGLFSNLLAKDEKELMEAGIPENIAKLFFRAKLASGSEFWEYVKQSAGFSKFLREKYFARIN